MAPLNDNISVVQKLLPGKLLWNYFPRDIKSSVQYTEDSKLDAVMSANKTS